MNKLLLTWNPRRAVIISNLTAEFLIFIRAMMSLGSSQPWNVTLQILNRQKNPKLDARPLMNYFQPLHNWLQSENRKLNYIIGFDQQSRQL